MFKKINEIKRNKSKKENKETIEVYKRPVFLIVGLISLIIVMIAIYMIFLNSKEVMRIEYDGYAISGKEITENLLGNSGEEDKDIDLTPVKEQDKLYRKLNSYFIGKNKRDEINLEYPIYINNNSTMYNLSQNMMLITSRFEELSGYPNLTATNGAIYNQSDLERVDEEEYFFLKNQDNVHTNLKEIRITTVVNEYVIPLNSNIYFDKESIRYYEVKDNKLIFKEIGDIDNNSKVQIGDKEASYQELLTKLGIIKEEKQVKDIEEEIIKEDTSEENEKKNEKLKKDEYEEVNKREENAKGKYVKPTVSCSPFEANVYTMSTNLTIQDPSKVIQGAITFEIKKDGKVYLRKTYTSSGEIPIAGLEPNTSYEIEGRYIYLNEQGQKVENTFYRDSITTKGLQELKSIRLSFENGEIFANKIQIAKLRINSDITEEAIKGVKRAEITIENASYEIKSEKLKQILSGQEIIYETNEGLKSNQKVFYEIRFFDKQGNEMKLENNQGETKTAKQKPSVTIRIAKQNVIDVTLGIKLNNKDNVEIQNYHYVIIKPNGDMVKEKGLQENDNEIYLEDLDPNQYYSIKVYGNYDVNNNKGTQENQVIGETIFATQPLSSLGYVNLEIEQQEVTTSSGKITIKIDSEKTDTRLIQILKEIKVQIINKGKNNQTKEEIKEDTIISETIIEGEELQKLKQGDTKEEIYENLKSNIRYEIKITAKVKLGEIIEEIQTTYDLKEFITLKKPTEVQMKNLFVTGDMIDFDVRIEDLDSASLMNKIRMELRDEKQNLIKLEYIKTNEEYVRKTFEKLELNKTYMLCFYADQYNEGSTDSTYFANYLIKEMKLITEPSIIGNIRLLSLEREQIGKNLVDVESNIKWYSHCIATDKYYGKNYEEEENILRLYGGQNNKEQYYVYDLRKYIGQTVTISFQAKVEGDINKVFLQKSKTSNLLDMTSDLNEREWTSKKYTLVIDQTGYVGFRIGAKEKDAYLLLKDLQIELGDKQTNYEKYQYVQKSKINVRIEDTKQQISSKDYYIRIYKDNVLTQESYYQDIGENGIADSIKDFSIHETGIYRVELLVKFSEREYVIDNQEFNSNQEEIKGIKSRAEFLEIQPRGNYIFTEQFDFWENKPFQCWGGPNLPFEGTIDFNGHYIDTNIDKYTFIFHMTGKEAVLKNVVLDVRYNNTSEFAYRYAFVYLNYGKIENIIINVIESVPKPNQSYAIIGEINYGTMDHFVINMQAPIYGVNRFCSTYITNLGIIKNGYVYGEDIEVLDSSLSIGVGGIVINNSGTLKNIYNLVSVNGNKEKANSELANITVGNSDNGSVQNVYSTNISESIAKNNRGPNVYKHNGRVVENSYYFSSQVFQNSVDQNTTPLVLRDSNFQNQILNVDQAFEVEELVEQGYYPHIIMPSCMPQQEYILLPKVKDEDLPDVLSIEVLEQKIDSLKVKFMINNPTGNTIDNIKIKNLNCDLDRETQKYENGKTEIIAYLNDPILCVSKYSVLSITTNNEYNIPYTRNFKEGEREIKVDLYRKISNVNDWKKMNQSPTENYMLTQDLDFRNEGNDIMISPTYTGKLNGDGHTIYNIILSGNAGGVIQRLKGEIHNLYIENYQNKDVKNVTNQGFICYLDKNAIVNHLHISNSILSKKEGSGKIGALVGGGNRGRIENSSVNGIDIKVTENPEDIYAGGIVGDSSNIEITNCFVQDLVMEVNNATETALGGILGKENDSGSISNCYATGKIKTDGQNIGGIVGKTTGYVKSNYSIVNISGISNYIGGIVGYDNTKDNSYIEKNLALGDVYNSSNSINSNRVIGNPQEGNINYAYQRQYINGYISIETLGAKLLSARQLLEDSTYRETLKMDNNFSYDELKKQILPKLYDTELSKLLPNQQDNILRIEEELEVKTIETEKTDVNTVNIRIEMNNPLELSITNLEIEDMTSRIIKNATRDGITYLDITATPNRFYDSYKITKIHYTKEGKIQEKEIEAKIEVQFYKELYRYEDWQSIEVGTYQNYRLMNDIDFAGKTDINTKITLSRLEGNGYTLKNIKLSFNSGNSGLINSVKMELRNIKFENIDIQNSGSGNNTGIIVSNLGEMEQILIHNITINAPNVNYVSCIARNESNSIKTVEMNEINVTGRYGTAGLIGYTYAADISDIVANKITVTCSSNYTAGIVGYIATRKESEIQNVRIENSHITGKYIGTGSVVGYIEGTKAVCLRGIESNDNEVSGEDYVGGVAGYSSYNQDIIVNRTSTKGRTYTGGAIGYSFSSANNIHVYESNVSSIGSYVGGICGYTYGEEGIRNSSVKNTTIESTQNNVGGLAGANERRIMESYAVDCTIKGNMNVGGLMGSSRCWTSDLYAIDCMVEGNSNVGGIIGKNLEGTITRTYNNSEIKGISNIGGIIGYLANQGMSEANNKSSLKKNYTINKIEGEKYIGVFIGNIEEKLHNPSSYYCENYMAADIITKDEEATSLGIGNMKTENSKLNQTYLYRYSKINGKNVDIAQDYFTEDRYLKEQDLKEQITYTKKLNWGSYFTYDILVNNKYPTINSTVLVKQEGIDLPKDSEHIVNAEAEISTLSLEDASLNSESKKEKLQETFEYNGKKIETYETYSAVTAQDGTSVRREERLYVKDGKLYVIDGSLEMVINNLIVDSYNGKEYETILGIDGKLYDLKNELNYPESFRNEKIKTIGNNLHQETKEITVTYEDGSKVTFNYQTGEIIEEQKVENNTSLLDYLKEQLETGNNLIESTTESYEENKTLISKLQITPIEKAMEIKNNENINNIVEGQIEKTIGSSNEISSITSENRGSYITVYNSNKKEFEVYKEEEILDVRNEEVVSQNEKIEKNNLNEYYIQEARTEKETSGIVWVLLSITGAIIVLFILWRIIYKGTVNLTK